MGFADEPLFPYPVPPDTMQTLQPRCDYVVSRWWQRCNFDHAMRNPEQFNAAFGAWTGLMPHASADTVHASIDALLARFVKKGPETLRLAQMAEGWLYSDTTEMLSEEIYKPFVDAVVANKKVSKADKAHFAAQQKVLNSSMIGATVPNLKFIKPDGSTAHLADIEGKSVLLYFDELDSTPCTIIRIRFETDPNTKALIDRGELAIVHVYAGKDIDKWKEASERYDSTWVNVALPDAEEYFDLRGVMPQYFFLNSSHKMLAKGLTPDYLLGAFEVTNRSRKK